MMDRKVRQKIELAYRILGIVLVIMLFAGAYLQGRSDALQLWSEALAQQEAQLVHMHDDARQLAVQSWKALWQAELSPHKDFGEPPLDVWKQEVRKRYLAAEDEGDSARTSFTKEDEARSEKNQTAPRRYLSTVID